MAQYLRYLTNPVYLLIAINVFIFVLSDLLKLEAVRHYAALYFPENDKFVAWQYFSSLFVHGGFTHLLFNMYGLWAFGSPLLQRWGTARFIAFYFVAGLGASVIYTLANYYQFQVIFSEVSALGFSDSVIHDFLISGRGPHSLLEALGRERLHEFRSIYDVRVIGASGAIYGVLVGFAFMFPQAKLAMIFFPVPIKAMFFVPLIILVDLFFGLTRYSVGNVAHFAHIGGAFTGLVIMLWWRYSVLSSRSR
ncbi:MAG: membrane associated rhomboid family serine protease [Flavobacteriales bacterium]|jgi:membrane associated rhomboid family serine protease